MSFFAAVYASIFIIVEITGILTALHSVLNSRTSQGAIAWAIVLITFPWLGLPLYWLFGRNRFNGYVEALRAGNMLSSNLAGRILYEMKKHSFALTHESEEDKSISNVFSYIAGMPFTSGNYVELLINGKATFEALFHSIENSKSYVLIEFFIVRNDLIGKKLKDILVKKANQGVSIYFIYDEIGSRKLGKNYINELKSAGVDIRPFFTTRGKRNRFQLNFRNHRKIVVIDGKSAFVGGHNVGKEYVQKTRKYGEWRDTHVYIEGPSVLGIQLTFISDWFWASRKVLELSNKAYISEKGDVSALPVPTDPSHRLDTCLLFFLNAIGSAEKRIWITSPYFVPDHSIVEALQLAALRGVDVKIILPGLPDKKIPYLASFSYLPRLFINGIKVYRYTPGFMHQKVILFDDEWAGVGSANLDNRSFYLNFEMNFLVKDKSFAEDVAMMLEQDILMSELVVYPDRKHNSWFFRLIVRLSSLFSPVL
ncbi:MAG: cardiolipin synthase [Desulforegulaceae bacterium]|nr:cardiolipin synthase [Desulforegulaceae bacterium]